MRARARTQRREEPALRSKPVSPEPIQTAGWRFTVWSPGRLLIREGAEVRNRKASDNLID